MRAETRAEKWFDSVYISKVELRGFVEELDVDREIIVLRMTPGTLAWATR